MSKKFKKYKPSLWFLLSLLSLSLVFGYLYKEKYLSCVTKDFSLCIKSNKYISVTEEFSFRYPQAYPITAKTGEELKNTYNSDFGSVEWVNFSSEFYPNAGGDRLGSVIIEKSTSYKNVREFGDKTLEDPNKLPEKYKGTLPKIEYMKVGGEDAIRITISQQPSSFNPPSDEYILIRTGKLYRISFDYNDYYHKSPVDYYQKGKQLILSTFTFN
ncbi:hypothetical protein HY358_00165 [Candidatus Roizmanbacteria bacterium]|nr:hypothetical protein [Candidatus Roizmanbacteria bacterium]